MRSDREGESIKSEPIFPATGFPVVPLTQAVDEERTLIAHPPSHSAPLYAAPVYVLPEEALSFTIDEAAIQKTFKEALQPRGLLRLRDSYLTRYLVGDLYQFSEVKTRHVELLFALKDEFGAQNKWELELLTEPKCRIPFNDIEYVTFKRWSFAPKLIIKLKPERRARFFEVDTVIREVVLYVSHRDAQLAKKLQSVMMAEVSTANLQRLLKEK